MTRIPDTSTWTKTRRAIAVALFLVVPLILAACNKSSSGSEAQAGKSAAASVTANPAFIKAKALVTHCFAGTPVQQAHQVHLVFLSSENGKHGDEVRKARAALLGCLGISKSDETPFVNDAVTAAHYGKVLVTHDGRVAYFGTTLPNIVLKYSSASGLGSPGSTVPGGSGAPMPTSPVPSTFSPTVTGTSGASS
jgi:hypothetical protein